MDLHYTREEVNIQQVLFPKIIIHNSRCGTEVNRIYYTHKILQIRKHMFLTIKYRKKSKVLSSPAASTPLPHIKYE